MAKHIIIVVLENRSTFHIFAVCIQCHRRYIKPIIHRAIVAVQIQCIQLVNTKVKFIHVHLNALNGNWFWDIFNISLWLKLKIAIKALVKL